MLLIQVSIKVSNLFIFNSCTDLLIIYFSGQINNGGLEGVLKEREIQNLDVEESFLSTLSEKEINSADQNYNNAGKVF